jgi:hypothetical protein
MSSLQFTFDVTDSYSGISTNAIALEINGVLFGGHNVQAITGGYRVYYSINAFSFGVTDSTPFQWQITATDNAGNTTSQINTLTIDQTALSLVSAAVGIAWDSETSQEVTGVNTAIKVVFSEDIDLNSVYYGDFSVTVDGVAQSVSSAVGGQGSYRSPYVYLTLGAALASNAEPVVSLVGTIFDLAGNIASWGDSVTASPME